MIGILGYYKDINELRHNEMLTYMLDRLLETLNYDPELTVNDMFDAEMTPEHIEKQTSDDALIEILEGENIDVPVDDSNFRQLNNFNIPGINKQITELFRGYVGTISSAGRVWFPEDQGYIGWHTKSNNPGFYLECSHSEDDDGAVFRYKDPITNKIITSTNSAGWNFRMFQVVPDTLFWHCTHSNSNTVNINYHLDFNL